MVSLTTCRDCGKRFQLQPLLDLPQPTRCMECLIGMEARYSREVSERRSLEAALSQKVGMRREFEGLLGCGDTYGDGAFETGLARLRALLAAEANGLALANRAFSAESELARELARRVAAEARCHDLERQRTEHDCRFVGQYAEMSGSHCPPGEPCQRCELEAAEARVRELEAALREIARGCEQSLAIRTEGGTMDLWCPDRWPDGYRCGPCIARRAMEARP